MSNNLKVTGDYYRNIILTIKINLEILHNEADRYNGIRAFFNGINRNIKIRQKQLDYYTKLLELYINEGRAE